MQEADILFLEDSFKKYYFNHFEQIKVPGRTSEREFGYQKFNSGMTRHIPIKDDKGLHLMLMQNVPSDVYCSNAYYTFPNLPMNEKDWKEADLIFDIDAKDLDLPCRKDHTVSICNECSKVSNGSASCCPKCNSSKLEIKSLPCKKCIDASKKEVSQLSTVLVDDLGVTPENIHVYFSGNEGFHVYVYDSQFQEIGSRERSELTDYISFRGAIPETFGMKKSKQNRAAFPDFDEKGWRGRFCKHVFGSKSRRSKIITELIADGYSSFQKTLDDASSSIGVKIDPSVTMDIHRIFRLPGSINSKSGLTKTRCDDDLKNFDPYTDASFLADDDKIQVFADCPIQFKLKDRTFGPYNSQKITTVPTFAAAYMICKKLARIA